MRRFQLLVGVCFFALALLLGGASDAGRGFKGGMMGGKKGGVMGGGQATEEAPTSPMHPQASRELHEKAGLFKTELRAVYPSAAECLEIKSDFGDQSRYDGSSRYALAFHGYHSGNDISADIGTPLVAVADGEVVHKYVGGRLVGNQIFLRHAPEDTGLPFWVYSKYKHFDQLPDLEIGDRVKMGQVLGPSGNTGTTGGYFGGQGYPHLHITILTSTSPDYETQTKAVFPKDFQYLDLVALYLNRTPPVVDNHQARDLPDAEKDVPIPYMTPAGAVSPTGTRLIWPIMCQPG